MIVSVKKEIPRLRIDHNDYRPMYTPLIGSYRDTYTFSYYKNENEIINMVLTPEMNPFTLRNTLNEFISKIGAAND